MKTAEEMMIEYTKRLKANPKDEDTLNKFNEAKFWL
jgi:hypothetical protein